MLKKNKPGKTKPPVKKIIKAKPAKKKSTTKQAKTSKSFPVVAIGSSAGGLKALSSFLKNLPAKTGMAYIIVQHLSKDHESFLTSILAKTTLMHVQEIDDMELMKPDNVYVIPYNKGIEVTNGHIRLIPRDKGATPVSIDVLFTSLAETHGKNVIGIVLSGNGKDGTKGLRAIKDVGGITYAQDDSAQSGSMPESAIAEGSVDYILSTREIAKSLAVFSKNEFKVSTIPKEKTSNDLELKKILEILFRSVHVDFSRYKMTTIKRRINHRIQLCNVKNFKEYAELLHKNKKEVRHLYKDLLINVTSFFRDKETYQYLKKTFLPSLLKKKSPGESLRIWIPACSSGEEAYSIAILLIELQERKIQKIPIQIFATDLSEQAIYDARLGEYSQTDIERIPKPQLKRFFVKTGTQYRVIKELRDMCVFATHNILSDPPFAHLDFISCCNLFIYFDASAQKKALTTLHFALNDGGFLMLGKSESVGYVSPLFTQVNKTFKIYSRKKNGGIRKIPELSPRSHIPFANKNVKAYSKKNDSGNSFELDKAIDAFLLAKHMPACAIINKEMEIIKFRGSTSFYLNHPSGNASLNILKMTRPEFAFELRSAIQQANTSGQTVRKTNIELNSEFLTDTTHTVTLEVSPLKTEWEEPLMLIIFNIQEQVESDIEKGKGKITAITQKDLKIKRQAEELKNVHAEMHAIIDAKETAFEELQAANEEIVSTNEEFQTLNEELETSKEEIEATNEELITANQELRVRNEQLAETYDFAENILMTLHEPFLILDKNMRVRSANDAFYKKFMVRKSETEGKLLFELGHSEWDIEQLRYFLEGLLKKNTNIKEYEITNMFPNIGKKTLLLNARQIVQKSQNEQLILLAFTDVTERTQKVKAEKYKLEAIINERTDALELSYKALEEKNTFLEKMNRELETFTFVSSHDLQEPLRKVKNFTSILLLEEKKNLSRPGKVYLTRMQETVARMQMLLEDLLAYSGVKNKGNKFEKTDLGVITKEIIDDSSELLKEKNAVIKTGAMCSAKIIRFQFRQVLQNLVSNSLKFTHPERKPVITIKSQLVSGRTLKHLQLSPTIKYCHIIFSDNGIGFDPKYKERIFEVFQRLHEYDEYKGTGIGLAICKRIIENHNGIIFASGKKNTGATFEIYIPA